jgi:hypothetical protein
MFKGKCCSFIFPLTILIALLCNVSCKKSPTGPSEPDIPAGSRNYIWTVDTLPQFPGRLDRMWGSSPDNIWASGDFLDRFKSVWHYDGKAWTQPSGQRIVTPIGLFGLSANNIWISTLYSELWHFDGSSWNRYTKIVQDGYLNFILQNIYGRSANDLYVYGYKITSDTSNYYAVLLHFDGKSWENVNIPNIRTSFFAMDYDEPSQTYILCAYDWTIPENYYKMYSFKDNILKEIYCGNELPDIGNINGQIYFDRKYLFTLHTTLNKYQNGTFIQIKDFVHTNYGYGVMGHSEKDFFMSIDPTDTSKGGIGHYNGTDIKLIFPFTLNLHPRILFNKDVFWIGDDMNSSQQYFIHGHLKDN